jgi:hypothetical protein
MRLSKEYFLTFVALAVMFFVAYMAIDFAYTSYEKQIELAWWGGAGSALVAAEKRLTHELNSAGEIMSFLEAEFNKYMEEN